MVSSSSSHAAHGTYRGGPKMPPVSTQICSMKMSSISVGVLTLAGLKLSEIGALGQNKTLYNFYQIMFNYCLHL